MEKPLGGEIYAVSSHTLLRIARETAEQSKTRELDAIVSLVFSAFYVEAATDDGVHARRAPGAGPLPKFIVSSLVGGDEAFCLSVSSDAPRWIPQTEWVRPAVELGLHQQVVSR
jgi:hypothetical protein